MSETITIYNEGGMMASWVHQITVEKNKDIIKTTISLDGLVDNEPETFTAKGTNLFQYLIELLNSNDLNLHTDFENLHQSEKGSSFYIEGVDGWEKNFILFCYGWRGDKQESNAGFFQDLEEKILKQIFSKFNNIDEIENLAGQIENLNEEFNTLSELHSELINLKLLDLSEYTFPDTLKKIADFYKFTSYEYIEEYEKLIISIEDTFIKKVNELNRLKNVDLKKFENLLNESDYQEKTTGSHMRGLSLKLKSDAERLAIKRFIKEYHDSNKEFPYGLHKIEDTIFDISSDNRSIINYGISLSITFPTPKEISVAEEEARLEKINHDKYLSSFDKYLESVEYEKPHSMSSLAASITNHIRRKSIVYFVEYHLRLNKSPPKGEFFISFFKYDNEKNILRYEDFKDKEDNRIFFK